MKLKRIGAALVTTLAVVTGSALVNATPAAAVGGCPSGKLCLWDTPDYGTIDVTSTSTKACIYLQHHGTYGFRGGIRSYVNNLPVNAVVYRWDDFYEIYLLEGTIRPGGFSSNAPKGWGKLGAVCMGGVNP
ncbi:peptidase inhibitor family I36 protein [Streptomyces sp. HMX87]|uniref:peptidase inhibitor family I36 protein n=1 Tax=Streptomyces sp. HMX87 TaxID=3390849 RepID=UPI003A84000A